MIEKMALPKFQLLKDKKHRIEKSLQRAGSGIYTFCSRLALVLIVIMLENTNKAN